MQKHHYAKDDEVKNMWRKLHLVLNLQEQKASILGTSSNKGNGDG